MVLLHPSSSQILLTSLPTQLCYYLLSCFKKNKKNYSKKKPTVTNIKTKKRLVRQKKRLQNKDKQNKSITIPLSLFPVG